MRHALSCRKFSRPTAHRMAMMANLAISLLKQEKIVTTLAKARDLRPFVEKLVTVAKRYSIKDSLTGNRLLLSRVGDKEVSGKLLRVLAERYKGRNGGYVRIIKCGNRVGDCAPTAIVELVERDEGVIAPKN